MVSSEMIAVVATPLRSIELTEADHRALLQSGFRPFIRFEPGRRIQIYAKLEQDAVWVIDLQQGILGVTVFHDDRRQTPTVRLDRAGHTETLPRLFGRVEDAVLAAKEAGCVPRRRRGGAQ